jgi:aryl-alcohol dehydrogenase-like predicted oxidoreductase
LYGYGEHVSARCSGEDGAAYRFVLNNPAVDLVLMAPANAAQFRENLEEIRKGPLSEEEMARIRKFGDFVHGKQSWFMGG